MRRLHRLNRFVFVSLLPLIWGAILGQAAMAQEAQETGDVVDVSMPVLVAILFLPPMIGMLAICFLKANRRDRDKPEQYKAVRLGEIDDGPKEKARIRPQRKGPEMCPDAQSALTMSIVGCFLFGLPGIFGIMKGLSAKKQIASDRRLTGEGTAMAAVAVGIGALVLWGIGIVVAVVMMVR